MSFHDLANVFLEGLFRQLAEKKISIWDHWDIDHICYRAQTDDSYKKLKSEFSNFGHLLIESEVNGRMISTFRLQNPIIFQGRRIDLVELPAPKKGKTTIEGFEHIEVVCDQPFSEIKEALSDCQFDEGGLAKSFNQELEIKLEGCAIKFHHLSLQSVIHLESKTQVFQALQQSRVLEILKPFEPLVAGTFPLDLNVENSDLDILFSSSDLKSLPAVLQKNFGHFTGYKCRQTEVAGQPTVIAEFQFQNVPFELFAQATSSVRQNGYRHFLIEERLLKYGGEKLKFEVNTLRRQGLKLKTEPAFARALGLEGDPYEALLQLLPLPSSELEQRLSHL